MNLYPVLILAGGLGTRLGKLSKNTPKSLMNINGKPFIDYQLKYLKLQGVNEVVICTGYLGEQIKNYVGNGIKFNLQISYSEDGPKKLGTGGAILKALRLLPDFFFVMYGDSFLQINVRKIQEFFVNNSCLVLMSIIKNDNKWDRSNVALKENNIIFYNKVKTSKKMHYIDYGISLISKKSFFKYDFDDAFDLSEFYSLLSIDSLIHGYIIKKRFYEIGSVKGISETEEFLKKSI